MINKHRFLGFLCVYVLVLFQKCVCINEQYNDRFFVLRYSTSKYPARNQILLIKIELHLTCICCLLFHNAAAIFASRFVLLSSSPEHFLWSRDVSSRLKLMASTKKNVICTWMGMVKITKWRKVADVDKIKKRLTNKSKMNVTCKVEKSFSFRSNVKG